MDIPLMVDFDPLNQPVNQFCRKRMVLCQRFRILFHCPVAHKPAVQGVHIFFKRLNLAGQCTDGFLIIRFQLKVFLVC